MQSESYTVRLTNLKTQRNHKVGSINYEVLINVALHREGREHQDSGRRLTCLLGRSSRLFEEKQANFRVKESRKTAQTLTVVSEDCESVVSLVHAAGKYGVYENVPGTLATPLLRP